MELRVLGPVELICGGRCIDLGHAKQRCVLAILLMEVGQVVSTGTLIDRVWGHAPPDAALNVLYGYVARLRKRLAAAGVRVHRQSGGYLLDVDPETVDVHRFRRLLAEVDPAAPPDRTIAVLDEALALWRGSPFAGLSAPWIATIRAVLEEQRLAAIIERNDARLRAGRYSELVSQLLELVPAHPMDERLVGQLMLAMYRSGRTAAALEQYRLARQRLRDELGADPGPVLRELQRRVLATQ